VTPLAYAQQVTLADLPGWAGELLVREQVARLAFRDADGLPRVLPITFALADERIWSAIDDKPKASPEPARVRWLRDRPEAALVVDVYDEDWSKLAWVQLLGRVEVLGIDDAPAALEALEEKYAAYRERRPPGPLLRLSVTRALHWRAAGESA
jgi:PPOX class probable F420-dependent enzyme